MKHLALVSAIGSLLGCQAGDRAPEAMKDVAAATIPAAEPTKVEPTNEPLPVEAAKAEPAKTEPAPIEPTPAEPAPTEPVADAEPAEPTRDPSAGMPVPERMPVAGMREVPIKPITTQSLTAAWRLVAEPAEAVSLVDLNAGVLARAGTKWLQRGEGDTLVTLVMDREPKLPVLGTWPSDAWFIETRKKGDADGGEGHLEMRMNKLRKGARWAPQPHPGTGEQWFRPDTDHLEEARISALSGMLLHTGELDRIDRIRRIAGKYPDPVIGFHRGTVDRFFETGAGEVYVLSGADDIYFVQVDCADEECLDAHTMNLPLPEWVFGRAVVRGRDAVSVLASACQAYVQQGSVCDPANAREFILHNHGKPDSWVLEEMPAGERASSMWASAAGGLWTLAGERLRWRDTKGTWHDVALPEGMVGPSVALTEDRTQVWVAGQVGGASKVFATSANAPAPAP